MWHSIRDSKLRKLLSRLKLFTVPSWATENHVLQAMHPVSKNGISVESLNTEKGQRAPGVRRQGSEMATPGERLRRTHRYRHVYNKTSQSCLAWTFLTPGLRGRPKELFDQQTRNGGRYSSVEEHMHSTHKVPGSVHSASIKNT